MLSPLRFRPLPFLKGRHVQTVVAAKLSWPREPPAVTRLVTLPDADRIALEVSTPPTWQRHDQTVVMLHGLGGCHRSPYLMRLAYKLWQRGIRAVRMNMRGCGSGQGLARQPYHSGRSADVRAVLDDLRQVTPASPLTLVGFSLGGNVILKLAGELQTAMAAYCTQVIAVCPPVDLAACSRLLAQPANHLYERHFVKLLQALVAYRHAQFADLPRVAFPRRLSLYEFDNLYTAPMCGFRDADDYYARCSAAPLVPRIAVPCRILFAADDPVIDSTVLNDLVLPPHLHVLRTAHGGHMGFLGIPGWSGGYRWLDAVLLEWIGPQLSAQQPTVIEDAVH